MSELWKFVVTENGQEVASGEGRESDCRREAYHYYAMYAQDGGNVGMNLTKVFGGTS